MEENTPNNKNSASNLLVPVSIIVAGFIIAGAVVYTNPGSGRMTGDKNADGKAAVGRSQRINPADLADDDTSLGDPKAPLTIVEFSDFQCPFCRRFYNSTLSQIKEQYIKTGKVKFVYRDFPLSSIHDMAQKYAEAAECAKDQGKFWAMHDKIFDEQNKFGEGTIFNITVVNVKKWARDLGLEGQNFDKCLDSGKYAAEVAKDLNDGQKFGVTGTPGTFVGSQLIQGAVPFAQFQAVIEEELKNK